VHARFNVGASSLPDYVKERLLAQSDARITRDGVVVIKAQESRSLERNKEDALRRLQEMVDRAGVVARQRKATRPTRGSQVRRVDAKVRAGKIKAMRGKVDG